MSKRFLYLTNTRLVSMMTQGKHIASRREFAVSGAGAAEFERHLASMAGEPTYLFTDLAEEDFRLDTIPHVGARDREAIVGRKLAQIFRNTPYRHAATQGREGEGRRDDRVIYTAITNPEILRTWVDAIERHKVPLVGIYSCAVFSSVLLEELDLAFANTLLVTFTPGNGMRQTYFKNNEIKFSRLTPMDPGQGQPLGAMIAEETTRTWQYLDSLRHFSPDSRLEVCVLVHPSDRAALQPDLRDFAQIQYRVIDIEQASTKLGLKPAPLDSSAEEIMIHLFLMRPAANHFASAEQRRYADLRRAKIALTQASAVMLLAGVAWAGYNLMGAAQAVEADEIVARQVADLRRQYDEIAAAMPTSFGVGGATMRDAVTFYNSQVKGFPSLPSFLRPLSGVLQSRPDVRLQQLSWQATDDPKSNPPLSATSTRSTPTVTATRKGGEQGGGGAPVAPGTTFSSGRYEVALLEATVRAAQNDYRGATENVQALAEAISRIPGYSADVAEGPLDLRSSLAIQGRYAEREPPTMEPRFVLRITRDRGAPT